jgi:hypothetical protein
MYDEALQYLREGADRGNSSTLAVEYASSIVKSDPEDARKRNESLWEEGHVAGLAGLGVDSGLGHNSIAHAIAFYAAEIAHIDGIPGSDPASNMFRAKIADLQNQVSPYEYQEAAEEAARLLRSPNCCIEP